MAVQVKIINKINFLKKFNQNQVPEQEDIWNSIAVPWGKYVVKKIPIVEEFLGDKKGKVIDLGCGSGRNMIPDKAIEYYGVDFSKNQLKHAKNYIKKRGIKAKLFKSRIDNLPADFKDRMFDYGLFIGALHCLESAEGRLNALKEFYRVLKQGAEGLVSVWNSEDLRFKGKDKDVYMSWRKNRIVYMRYYYLFFKEEFLGLLRSVGFEVLEFYACREHDRFSKKNWIVRVRKI